MPGPRFRGRAPFIAKLLILSAAFAGGASAAPLPDPRYAQAAATLPDGKILVVGGIDATGGAPLATAEILDTTKGSESVVPQAVSAAMSMNFARSSATITVLPTGNVLVTGGWDGGAARSDAEVYSPSANAWTVVPGMQTGRFDHTATLLNNGKVLVCGGENPLLAPPVTATCDLFTPLGAGGSFAATGSLQQARGLHSAVLLNDGTVWISGGWNPSVTPAYLVTGERYSPVAGQFQQTVPLAVARANHTATLTGDNKVFVAGGFNGASLIDPNGFPTLGYIESTEIFDPSGGGAGTIVAGPPLQAAIEGHSAILLPGGLVSFYGGLGNVTSTKYAALATTFDPGSVAGGAVTASYSAATTPPGAPINLGSPVTGTIIDGALYFFNVTITTGGPTYSVPFASASLNGVSVDCDASVPPICGRISSDLVFKTITGVPGGTPLGGAAITFPPAPANAFAIAFIGHMVFSDREFFVPNINQTTFQPPNVSPLGRPGTQRFGSSAVLTTTGVEWDIGGSTYNVAGQSFGPGNCGHGGCPVTGARADSRFFLTAAATTAGGADPLKHAYHTANLLPNGTILVAGGTDGVSVLNSAEIFSPATQAFTPTVSAMAVPREQHSATLLPNGRVLIVGGLTTASSSTANIPVNSAEIYYPDAGVFLAAAPMISSHSQHVALALPNGNVFIAGGYSGASGLTLTNVAEIYQSTKNAWIPAANMPNASNGYPGRAIAAAVELKDGTILVCGGTNSGGDLGDSLIYNPATNAWTATDPLPFGAVLEGHTATLLRNGLVLVVGGDGGFGETTTAYTYDPSAAPGSHWGFAQSLNTDSGRYAHSATLLPNGTVLISGGLRVNPLPGATTNALPSAQYFFPDFEGWSATATFTLGSRSFQTATLAQDGNVYFIGGTNGSIGANQSTRFYNSFESLYLTVLPDEHSINFPSVRQSTITFAGVAGATPPSPFLPGANFTASGLRFRGATEASGGGGGPANSSFNGPHLQLQRFDSSSAGSSSSPGFLVNLTTQVYANPANLATMDTNLIAPLPASNSGLPVGWYMTWIGANDVFTGRAPFVQVGPPLPVTAPTGLIGTAQGVSSITWRWNDSVAGIDGYNIYQSSSGIFIATIAANGGVGQISYTQTGLTPNVRVQVLVAGYTLSGDGPTTLSGPVSVNPITTINTIGCGVNSSGDTTTSIQWNWNAVASAASYNVFNSTSGDLIKNTASPSFYDVNLATNSTRAIVVGAVTGGVQGPLSPGATCYTLAAVPSASVPVLTSTESTSVSVAWTLGPTGSGGDGNPTGTTYVAQLNSFLPTAAVTKITVVSPALPLAYFNRLSPGNYYSAQVVALNGAGFASAPLNAGTTFTLPAQPQSLAIQGTTPVSITGSWNTNSNSTMTFYQLTYSTDNFTTAWSTAIPFSSRYNGSTFFINGLLTSVQYSLQVQAENPFGQTSAAISTNTTTFNGGAPAGSLAGILAAAGISDFSGNLGGPTGRVIDMRSPSGAFPSDTNVTISTYGLADHGGVLCPGGVPGRGGVDGVALSIVDAPSLQPNHPIFLTGSYAPGELGTTPVSDIALERFDPGSGTCVPMPTTFNPAAGTFLAQLNHFSLYQLVAVPLATSADSARIYPNPYRAATDGFVTIDMVPPASRVRIFTLRGEKILDATADGTGTVTWTADNTAGRPVASGLYLVAVESGGSKKILKLAVIR